MGEVLLGQARLQGEQHVVVVDGFGLGAEVVAFHRCPDAAPQVEFPTGTRAEHEPVVLRRRNGKEQLVDRVAPASSAEVATNGRVGGATGDAHGGKALINAGQRRVGVRVGSVQTRDQLIQGGVIEQGPPFRIVQPVRGAVRMFE